MNPDAFFSVYMQENFVMYTQPQTQYEQLQHELGIMSYDQLQNELHIMKLSYLDMVTDLRRKTRSLQQTHHELRLKTRSLEKIQKDSLSYFQTMENQLQESERRSRLKSDELRRKDEILTKLTLENERTEACARAFERKSIKTSETLESTQLSLSETMQVSVEHDKELVRLKQQILELKTVARIVTEHSRIFVT